MNVVLVMFRENGERRSFSLTRDVTVIGRREDADFRIPLSDVSRKHTRLIKDGHALLVEDLGSSNGTYHNGVRVQEAEVHPGDTLQIGPIQFVVQIDGVPTEDELLGNTGGTSTHLANNNFSMGAGAVAGAVGGAAAAMGGAEHDEPLVDDQLIDAGELEELEEVTELSDAGELDEIADFDDLPVRPAVPVINQAPAPASFAPAPLPPADDVEIPESDVIEPLEDDLVVEEPEDEVISLAPLTVDEATEEESITSAADVVTTEDVVADTSALVTTGEELIATNADIAVTPEEIVVTESDEPKPLELSFAEGDEPEAIDLPPLSLDTEEAVIEEAGAEDEVVEQAPPAPPVAEVFAPQAPVAAPFAEGETTIEAAAEATEDLEVDAEFVESEAADDEFLDIDINAESTAGDDDILIDFGDPDPK